MKTTDVGGNGQSAGTAVRFTTEVIEENPYLQSPHYREHQERHVDSDNLHMSIEDEDGSAIELDEEVRKTKQRRRRLAIGAVAAMILVGLIGALALYSRRATRVEYGQSTKQREVITPPPNAASNSVRDIRTEQAIEEAQRLTVGKTQEVAGANPAKDSPKLTTNSETPFTVPSGFNEPVALTSNPTNTTTNSERVPTVAGSPASTSQNVEASRNETTFRSQRSSETSFYISERTAERTSAGQINLRVGTNTTAPTTTAVGLDPIVLPAFASMLPVRTIGALYTLRTGALARFELTRDIKGDGWEMKRGTILVGTSKGSDSDRAYVGIIGFIEPRSGKLVKLGGEVRGGDGGAGLKGKRRQLDSGWVRAFSRLGGAALDVTGALLSGRGRDTVIVSDGLRTRTINPVTDEISGLLGNELDRRQSRSFVEVLAGTPGYVMVTDLPSVIKGQEPVPDVNNDSLAGAGDVDAIRPTTGLSERELADLLANGSPEDIRSAMVRMSPEMRKIAAAVLR
jgi:hypothetical protein